jgi:hypothetical protein
MLGQKVQPAFGGALHNGAAGAAHATHWSCGHGVHGNFDLGHQLRIAVAAVDAQSERPPGALDAAVTEVLPEEIDVVSRTCARVPSHAGHGQGFNRSAYAPLRSRHSRSVDRLMPLAIDSDRRLLPASMRRNISARVVASYTPPIVNEFYDENASLCPGSDLNRHCAGFESASSAVGIPGLGHRV